MCSPALAVMGTQVMGVGMSTVGSFFGAKSQKSQLRHEAAMAEINATIIDAEARNVLSAGVTEESRLRMAGSRAKSEQIAQMSQSGVDIAGSNSALARLTGNDLITEVDANQIRANALRAAWGQRMAAGDARRGAVAKRASAASISPGFAAFTSLVSGAGQVASSWYSLDKVGAFDKKKSTRGTVTVSGGSTSTDTAWNKANAYGSGMPW